MPAYAFEQFALPALFTLSPRGNARLVREHFLVSPIEVNDKLLPKLLYRIAPRQLALFDFLQFFFHSRGELQVENVFKTLYQQFADALAKHGG